jgi:hypothetical protein
MDVLDLVAVEIPCGACGGRYEITLKQIALSQRMIHEGCPVRVVAECPPLAYSGLVDQEVIQELRKVWVRLEEEAEIQEWLEHTVQPGYLPSRSLTYSPTTMAAGYSTSSSVCA